MRCCSPARTRAKKVARAKATRIANSGGKIKRSPAKKTHAKQTPAKKAPPCRICGGKK